MFFLAREAPANDSQFGDEIPFVAVIGSNAIDEAVIDAFAARALGLGHDVIAFQAAAGRRLERADFVRVEAEFFDKRSIFRIKNRFGGCRHDAYRSKILCELICRNALPGGGR